MFLPSVRSMVSSNITYTEAKKIYSRLLHNNFGSKNLCVMNASIDVLKS